MTVAAFFFDYKGKHIVLSTKEELELRREIIADPRDRMFFAGSEALKRYDHAAFVYLRKLHDNAPGEFHRRFYWRSLVGDRAREMFPVLLDAYARAHRLAVLGHVEGGKEDSWTDPLERAALSEFFGHGREPVWITMIHQSRLAFWRKWGIQPICQIAIDPMSIDRLVGCVENFLVSTSTLTIWFGRKRVRVFSYAMGEHDIAKLVAEVLPLAGAECAGASSTALQIDPLSFVSRGCPETATEYYDRGCIQQAKGNLQGAIADYTRAIELLPRYGPAFNNRGAAREATGELDAAIADYTRAIELDPRQDTQVNAYCNRGIARQVKGELNAAVADFTYAIKLDAHRWQAWYGLGLARAANGQAAQAIAALEKAHSLAPAGMKAPIATVLQKIRG